MSSSTRFYRYLALCSHLLLIAWIILWQFYFQKQFQYSPVFVGIVYVLPLLLPLPGIITAKPYTHAWANFVVLFYLLHSLTVIYAVESERYYALVELALCIGMFIGCSVFARKRGRELGLGLKKLKTVMQEERERFEGRK
ncbi:DUF2069 domain-containing protein [Alteromonas aestuariivivens]|uniref:DUF2069 domain-containing protein n=1 Tax=Alteromonas aestuariivivens TaxID=1938339 RepID=A0A3D8MB43_9ALTE|nr:DUF2069 domain-containing protein [Alteromonas aestuariivivens]RDV27325.1 DUF2069 domain-containing protein [Alteromonas aestuariivivens]